MKRFMYVIAFLMTATSGSLLHANEPWANALPKQDKEVLTFIQAGAKGALMYPDKAVYLDQFKKQLGLLEAQAQRILKPMGSLSMMTTSLSKAERLHALLAGLDLIKTEVSSSKQTINQQYLLSELQRVQQEIQKAAGTAK